MLQKGILASQTMCSNNTLPIKCRINLTRQMALNVIIQIAESRSKFLTNVSSAGLDSDPTLACSRS